MFSIDLLIFTTHRIVPVHERALGVIPPSPHVQLEKGEYAIPVRAVNLQEGLALEHRRAGVILEPGRLVCDELDAHQPHRAVRRLIDQRLRVGDINLAIEQSAVYIMHTHGAVVRTADAAKKRRVSGRGGIVDVDELFCGRANELNELGRGAMFVSGLTHCEERRGHDQAAQQRQM